MTIVGSFFSMTLLAASLNIEFSQPVDDEKAAEIVEWVESTADNVKAVYGRFPNPDAKVIIIPTRENSWGSDSAVIFGRVTRSGGETVELFVNPDRPIEEFYSDWTATHEFSHLMMPLLDRRYRWISEGFATYYQNILMSRASRYTPELAWQRLSEGFDRGRDSRPELSPNEAASAGIRQARMKVYWSGAAIALLADVELRLRSGGEESLDSVLDQLQACCLPSKQKWSGKRLFEKLDSFVDTPVFMPLYRKYADEEGFPEPDSIMDELGVTVKDDGTVELDSNASLAAVRKAISAPQ
jgi:hypothetical protein